MIPIALSNVCAIQLSIDNTRQRGRDNYEQDDVFAVLCCNFCYPAIMHDCEWVYIITTDRSCRTRDSPSYPDQYVEFFQVFLYYTRVISSWEIGLAIVMVVNQYEERGWERVAGLTISVRFADGYTPRKG